MPLDAVSHRDAGRRHAQKTALYIPSNKTQQKLNHVAASMGQNHPTECTALSMLYLSALVLPNVLQIRSSPAHVNQACHTRGAHYSKTTSHHNASFPDVVHMVTPMSSRYSGTLVEQNLVPAIPHDVRFISQVTPTLSVPSAKNGATGWFNFPTSMAAADLPVLDYLQRDIQNNVLIAHGDAGKDMLLNLAKDFMSTVEKINQHQLQNLEFEWRQAAALGPISIARIDIETPFTREKRISHTEHNQNIINHIRDHCAEELEIYNSEGLSEGKMLILIAQRIENPFRMLYDDIDGFTPSKGLETASQTLNFMINVITLGVKPLISSPFANSYRRRYYEGIGDDICARRQNHITFAQIATSLDVSGTKVMNTRRATAPIPIELQNTRSLHELTTYIAHDKNKNIRTNLSLLVRNKKPQKSQSELALKAKEDNEFETYYPDPADPSGQRKRVVFDPNENIWHYDDGTDQRPLDVRLKQGETFISLFGKHFPIREVGNGKYEIIAKTRSGINKKLPVYCEPLSKTWHLETVNGHAVFTSFQKDIIEKIHIAVSNNYQYHEINNIHPHRYGNGKLYEVRNLQDNVNTTPPLYTVIEINSELVPVKSLINKKTGAHYYAYDINVHSHVEYPLEWTGKRWILERSTSPHASLALVQRITPDMYVQNLNEDLLSAPDKQGIKWANGQGYLNIRNQHVEIHKGAINQIGPENGNQLIVYYANQQFHPLMPGRQMLIWRKQLAEFFYDVLKDASRQHLQDSFTFNGIEKAAKVAFVSAPLPALRHALPKAPVEVNVEVVSSSDVGRKRYLVTLGENDYFFVEVSHDGKQVWVLKDEESELAMEKHQRNLAGGAIPLVVSLKRNIELPLFRPNSRAQVDVQAFAHIESGARIFGDVLKGIAEKGEMDTLLIVGHADFLMTAAFENNVFSTTDNAYQALIDAFIPLSKAYPNAIIIPGSIYVSENIPPDMLQQSLYYQQSNRRRRVGNAVNFATVLAPVLHKGKFVTIARKGEYLTYTLPDAPPDAAPVAITSLGDKVPYGATMNIVNAPPSPSVSSSEWNDAHTGTIYAGRTLLPTEKTQAEWFFCPCRDKYGNEVGVDRFFSNEFVIDDEKFLIVIENEFIQHGETRPTVRTLSFPQNETTDDTNRYDWIIHLGTTDLDEAMLSSGYNYLQADRNSNSQFFSNVSQRTLVKTFIEKQQLLIFEFSSD